MYTGTIVSPDFVTNKLSFILCSDNDRLLVPSHGVKMQAPPPAALPGVAQLGAVHAPLLARLRALMFDESSLLSRSLRAVSLSLDLHLTTAPQDIRYFYSSNNTVVCCLSYLSCIVIEADIMPIKSIGEPAENGTVPKHISTVL